MHQMHGNRLSHVDCERMMTRTRLDTIRASLVAAGLDAFVLSRADEHLGEYVPPSAERLAWLTGFTGSAGLAVVLPSRAALFTDGRYTLQAEQETDPALFERLHVTDEPPQPWLRAQLHEGARVGYDPRLFSAEGVARYEEAGLAMVPMDPNPVDRAWTDRPAPPMAPAVPHEAGTTSTTKRENAAKVLRDAKHDAAVLTDAHSIAWLLNIRGGDLPYTPVALGFALLGADASVRLFMHPDKLPQATRDWLAGIDLQPPEALPAALDALAGRTVRVDPAGSPIWFAQSLEQAGAKVVQASDPCLLPKACKDEAEQRGARAAHRRDAVALIRFLAWLEQRPEGTDEHQAAERLLAFRREVPGFHGESFPAISGAGPNGAVIHYRVTPATARLLADDEAYLIDSGAQYKDGTTDVTRTLWTGPGTPPEDVRHAYTRVLQGHIALATARFPRGVAGPHLDALARRPLWDAGLDYDHGTGHGVGSFLSVHEGPAGLSRAARPVPLAPGMILSDEPGYYEPGRYGIRLENLLLVMPDEGPTRPFLRFETLTLAPFDRRLIDLALLSPAEREWLDAYHARVLAEVGPNLPDAARLWLERATKSLPHHSG